MSSIPEISFKRINKLAIPAVIAGVVEPLLSVTDTAIVGNVSENSTEVIAAVGIAGSFISAIIWIMAQTRSAISATVSRYLGAKKVEEILTMPAQILMLNTLLSLFILASTYFFATSIFSMYSAKDLVLDFTVEYYKIRAFGFPFTLFVLASFGLFRGLQNTYYPMIISILGFSLNVILDFALVYGIEGIIPPMHLKGAAWASVISQFAMVCLTCYLILKKTPFTLRFSFPWNKEIKTILKLSANLIVRGIALNAAIYFANKYATSYGDEYIAAHTISFQIWMLFAFIIDGYSSVGNIVSGKFLGEKKLTKLVQLSKKLIIYSLLIASLLSLICSVFYFSIGRIFTQEEKVLEAFYDVFWIVLAMQPLNAIAFVYDGIYKGLAAASTLRNLLLIATFLGFIPALLFFDFFGLQLTAIWIAFVVWMLLRGGILMLNFRRKYVH